MNWVNKVIQLYFDRVYTPVYDLTTAQFSAYRKLQESCIGKLELGDNDKVLCVGIGTGNELQRIFKINPDVHVTGIDYSIKALAEAQKKALALNGGIDTHIMDARYLAFDSDTFDRVICIHVTDFINDIEQVTGEILRVLNPGGQFIITYPSDGENWTLGVGLFQDTMRDRSRHSTLIRKIPVILLQILLGFAYLPLLLRPHKRTYAYREIQQLFKTLDIKQFQIQEEPSYHDYIVYGKKQSKAEVGQYAYGR